MTISILHDCDPGNDDALGILVALGSPHLSLAAVTTGAGHLAADRTGRNAAITLGVAGARAIPVTRGAPAPLVRERLIAGVLDLDSALDGERPDLPAVAIDETRTSAETIADLASRMAGLTIVTTGPFTNLALALRNRPSIAGKIARIVALGGAWGLGNKTAAAEWNVLCDPEAASIVFGAGVPMTLLPIDATAQVMIDDALVESVAALRGRATRFATELLRSLRATFKGGGPFAAPDMPLNDPLALLVAAEPALARTIPARVDVELAGRFTYGRTVIDFAGKSGLPPNCEIAIQFDVAATRLAFTRSLAHLSENSSSFSS
ncbi:nucleoside hydrolase [Methylocapsa sp. S129]|uniref:nucleoside hydrolase n=1 Tax=Methylocapsa sp. S129 TaxID=1641869 RepID=UPI00131E1AB2|nr:nucleoside hydrolase [Methylocapsa sp. S129]